MTSKEIAQAIAAMPAYELEAISDHFKRSTSKSANWVTNTDVVRRALLKRLAKIVDKGARNA